MGVHSRSSAPPGTGSGGGRTDRPRRAFSLVVLLAAFSLLAAAAVWGVPALLDRAGIDETALPWGPECTVATEDGDVSLSLEQARSATTAAALEERGAEAPDTSGIDPGVLDRLRTGPPEDAGPSLTCRASPSSGLEAEEMTASGLTPRAARLLDGIREVFGDVSVGGFAPGGIDSGHGEGSTHYEGRAIDVFYRPVDEENRREGWLLAHWLVAHAEEYHIAVVIFDDRIWNVRLSAAGWRDYASPDPDNEILRHLDHVHVDVQRGG